nr:hypothetical protein [Bacillus cereus]
MQIVVLVPLDQYIGPVILVAPVGPLGNVNGGIGGSVGPIEFESNAALFRIPCESNSFSSDMCHLQKVLIILNKCVSEAFMTLIWKAYLD